jgi:hypothetical protein
VVNALALVAVALLPILALSLLFERNPVAQGGQVFHGSLKGYGAFASLRGPAAREDEFPIAGRTSVKDLLIGQVPGFAAASLSSR